MVALRCAYRVASRQKQFTDENAKCQDLPNRLDTLHYRLFTIIVGEATLWFFQNHLLVGLLNSVI